MCMAVLFHLEQELVEAEVRCSTPFVSERHLEYTVE